LIEHKLHNYLGFGRLFEVEETSKLPNILATEIVTCAVLVSVRTGNWASCESHVGFVAEFGRFRLIDATHESKRGKRQSDALPHNHLDESLGSGASITPRYFVSQFPLDSSAIAATQLRLLFEKKEKKEEKMLTDH
jgi:hypothetical protein